MIGTVLSHHRIIEKLGAGGMGEVYRAHDEQLDRDVALKILPALALTHETARTRLLREARAAAALNHPHICTIHEVGEAGGQAYIAMELVEGKPLSELVPEQGLPVDTVLLFGSQIAGALAHAHERRVVHRDLKSANVMITTDGRAKVLDFGLAKRVSGEELAEATTQTEATLTQTGALIGTVPYMAPEQLRGQPADARSDVWALGVVLYEMAAGRRPFQGQTGYELSSAILNQAPAPLPPKVPTQLWGVIERCLPKEPGERYQRGSEVQAALEAVQSGAALPALPTWRYVLLRRRWFVLAVSVMLLLTGLGVLNLELLRTRFWGGAPRIRSLAVLPLANLSGDPGQEYFSDGMTEELITDLGKISALRVISRTSVMQYKQTRKALPTIAQELNVDAVVEGSVLRSGNRVRITAQLIQAKEERHLWAESYERDLGDVLALQREVARAIANEIKIGVTVQEQTYLASARPVNPETHELYLRGLFFWNMRTEEGARKSLDYYQQALNLDPRFAPAYSGMALSHMVLANRSFDQPDQAWRRVKDAALKALELDEALAEAHAAWALYNYGYAHDWPTMEKELLRAIQLNPSYATAHAWLGECIAAFGRLDEALVEVKRGQELDPLSRPTNNSLGLILYLLRRYSEATLQFRKTLELHPTFATAHWGLGKVYQRQGKLKEALEEFRKAVELSGSTPYYVGQLGGACAMAGRKDEALALLRSLEEQSKHRYVTPHAFAEIYAGLGEKDRAIQSYEKAFEEHSVWIGLPYFKVDPQFDSWRSDPRFQALLRRMNFPQ